MSTTECSWRLCPTPGMYAVTSMPLVRRTRATLRRAELGFFGVVVYTRVHTPRRCGEPFSAGVLVLPTLSWRPLRTSWLIVGNLFSVPGLVVLSRPAEPGATGLLGVSDTDPRTRVCRNRCSPLHSPRQTSEEGPE